jgi:hypothetical protein
MKIAIAVAAALAGLSMMSAAEAATVVSKTVTETPRGTVVEKKVVRHTPVRHRRYHRPVKTVTTHETPHGVSTTTTVVRR